VAETCVSLIPGITELVADKGYDTDAFRSFRKERGIKTVIPGKSNRKKRIRYDKEAYKEAMSSRPASHDDSPDSSSGSRSPSLPDGGRDMTEWNWLHDRPRRGPHQLVSIANRTNSATVVTAAAKFTLGRNIAAIVLSGRSSVSRTVGRVRSCTG
jgi:hypothetical protein